jgi:hypothetical protein
MGELLAIASSSVGVITGLSSQRGVGYAPSIVGAVALGAVGAALNFNYGKPAVGQMLMWTGAGIAVGSTISALSQKKLPGANTTPPVVPELPPPQANTTPGNGMPTMQDAPVADTTVPTWNTMQPTNGSFTVTTGTRYRATASVGNGYTRAQVQSYLSSNGWTAVTVYDTGDNLPSDWPLENIGTLESGRRWVRVDAVRTGTVTNYPAQPKILFFSLPLRIAEVWICT